MDGKVTQIQDACRARDLDALVALATSERGLVDDQLRRAAWPLLLGCSDAAADAAPWQALPPHREEDQVRLDVNRSFVYYPPESERQLDGRKEQLFALIASTLRRHPALCYFQGYHDIVQVFLLVLQPDGAPPAVARLSLLRIRDFMLPSLAAAVSHLQLLPAILFAIDPGLYSHLPLRQPFFALASTLTMYAHDIQSYGQIARLYDFLLAHEAVLSVYLFAVMIRVRRDELLDIPPDEPDIMHAVLSKLPRELKLEEYISEAMAIFAAHPPETLPFHVWRRIPYTSVLKTTRRTSELAKQSLEDGEKWFETQAADMARKQYIAQVLRSVKRQAWIHRRSMGVIGLTVAVGCLSWWMRRRS